jgi:regulator of protease activity HflC (stomatin/prohibitin superfamily)
MDATQTGPTRGDTVAIDKSKLNPRPFIVGAIVIGLGWMLYSGSSGMFETNLAGHIMVVQMPFSGEIKVYTEAGMYYQAYGKVTIYKVSDTVGFGAERNEAEFDMGALNTRFNDGASATIYGSLRVSLPSEPAAIAAIQRQFRSYEGLINQVVRPAVANAIYTTGPHMSSAESYQARRNEFQGIALDQLLKGVYETLTVERETRDIVTGEKSIRTLVEVKRDDKGFPVRQTASLLEGLGMHVDQFVINKVEYEQRVYEQIKNQQEARMAAVTARAAAERAEQEAKTARAQGEAQIAHARAEQEVEKTKVVTQAEASRDRARLEAERADFQARGQLAIARAEAEANRLKVAAGLTPQERAEWDNKTAVGVAAELAKAKVPDILISGGGRGEGTGYGNPALDALTIQMLRDAVQRTK